MDLFGLNTNFALGDKTSQGIIFALSWGILSALLPTGSKHAPRRAFLARRDPLACVDLTTPALGRVAIKVKKLRVATCF
jgi:hypothetical protein